MSNLSNFYGDSNMTLGPANIYYNPSIGSLYVGTDLALGGTQGLSIAKAIEKGDLTKDQYGTSPANRVVTGQSQTVTASLVELTLERLNAIMQGFEHYTATGGATLGFSWEDVLGQADDKIEKPLKFALIEGDGETTDPDKIIYIPNAAPMVDTEISYDASTQRVLALDWNCYRRPKWKSTVTGKELFLFSQSMVDNGLVAYDPGTT
jgi:hypothetical protein